MSVLEGVKWLNDKVVLQSKGSELATINEDIQPLPPSRRTWDRLAFVSFWATNNICITNWQTGASLVAVGLSVWQAIIATISAKIVIALVAVFNGYVGAQWHIGFPVVSRCVWGIYGSYLALLQRILLSLVWMSVQSWTGGLCVAAILEAWSPSFKNAPNIMPANTHMTQQQFTGWVVYNVISVPIMYYRPEKTRRLLFVFNTISLITLFCMMTWAIVTARGAGPLLSESSMLKTSPQLGWGIVSGVSSVVGSIAVGLTNQPDYSRFARRPGDQVFGQYFSILLFGTFVPLFGMITASATQEIFGVAFWNPPLLVIQWLESDYSAGARAAATFAGIGLVCSQLAINTVDNTFSTGMDMAGLFPKYINIRRGSYVGLILSIVMQPWQLLSSASTFITVLSAYSVFLGPMVGIMVCDYWVIRSKRVKLSDLYDPRKDGIYYFWYGLNWCAFIAWIIGFAPQIPGFINAINPDIKVPTGCVHLFALAFPLGFAISFALFWLINKTFPPDGLGQYDPVDIFGTFTDSEAADLGVVPLTNELYTVPNQARLVQTKTHSGRE